MDISTQRPKGRMVLSIVILALGLLMIVYWTMYVVQGMPLEGIPLAPELLAATLALITGYGLLRQRNWSYATGCTLAGLWIYGVVGGLQMVATEGLDFQSPIGALTDALLFVLVLGFSIYLTIFLWKRREQFV